MEGSVQFGRRGFLTIGPDRGSELTCLATVLGNQVLRCTPHSVSFFEFENLLGKAGHVSTWYAEHGYRAFIFDTH
jgi:hypothetical protein